MNDEFALCYKSRKRRSENNVMDKNIEIFSCDNMRQFDRREISLPIQFMDKPFSLAFMGSGDTEIELRINDWTILRGQAWLLAKYYRLTQNPHDPLNIFFRSDGIPDIKHCFIRINGGKRQKDTKIYFRQ